jgi:hypothetical protein
MCSPINIKDKIFLHKGDTGPLYSTCYLRRREKDGGQ